MGDVVSFPSRSGGSVKPGSRLKTDDTGFEDLFLSALIDRLSRAGYVILAGAIGRSERRLPHTKLQRRELDGMIDLGLALLEPGREKRR